MAKAKRRPKVRGHTHFFELADISDHLHAASQLMGKSKEEPPEQASDAHDPAGRQTFPRPRAKANAAAEGPSRTAAIITVDTRIDKYRLLMFISFLREPGYLPSCASHPRRARPQGQIRLKVMLKSKSERPKRCCRICRLDHGGLFMTLLTYALTRSFLARRAICE